MTFNEELKKIQTILKKNKEDKDKLKSKLFSKEIDDSGLFLVITESPISLKDFEGSPKIVVDISNKYFQDDSDREKILEKLIFLSQEYENHRMHLKTVYSKLINEIKFIKTKNVLIDNKELLLFIAEVTAFFF